jgi:hypothetical protein
MRLFQQHCVKPYVSPLYPVLMLVNTGLSVQASRSRRQEIYAIEVFLLIPQNSRESRRGLTKSYLLIPEPKRSQALRYFVNECNNIAVIPFFCLDSILEKGLFFIHTRVFTM